jgi:hypothetical protein
MQNLSQSAAKVQQLAQKEVAVTVKDSQLLL